MVKSMSLFDGCIFKYTMLNMPPILAGNALFCFCNSLRHWDTFPLTAATLDQFTADSFCRRGKFKNLKKSMRWSGGWGGRWCFRSPAKLYRVKPTFKLNTSSCPSSRYFCCFAFFTLLSCLRSFAAQDERCYYAAGRGQPAHVNCW